MVNQILAISMLCLIIFTGCSRTTVINEGEFYEFCQSKITNDEKIEKVVITYNTQKSLTIDIYMKKGLTADDEDFLEIYEGIKEYLWENLNENGILSDSELDDNELRGIKISFLYDHGENYDTYNFNSRYYGGDTIYSDDELNVIDNFKTWSRNDRVRD